MIDVSGTSMIKMDFDGRITACVTPLDVTVDPRCKFRSRALDHIDLERSEDNRSATPAGVESPHRFEKASESTGPRDQISPTARLEPTIGQGFDLQTRANQAQKSLQARDVMEGGNKGKGARVYVVIFCRRPVA